MSVHQKRNVTLEEIAAILECPVCLQHPEIDELLQCCHGHWICVDCFSKLRYCPVCRIGLGKNKVFSNEIVSSIKSLMKHLETFRCSFSNEELEVLTDMFRCVVCLYKPTRSPVRQCNNGHLICVECYFLPSAPWFCIFCGSIYLEAKIRNLVLISSTFYKQLLRAAQI